MTMTDWRKSWQRRPKTQQAAAEKRVLKQRNHRCNRRRANRALAAGDFDADALRRWRRLEAWEVN
jgi:hypothetical protein